MGLKEQLKKQLVANIIKDKCKHCGQIIFDEALCTQDRIIRFETPYTQTLGINCGYEVENHKFLFADLTILFCFFEFFFCNGKCILCISNRLFDSLNFLDSLYFFVTFRQQGR